MPFTLSDEKYPASRRSTTMNARSRKAHDSPDQWRDQKERQPIGNCRQHDWTRGYSLQPSRRRHQRLSDPGAAWERAEHADQHRDTHDPEQERWRNRHAEDLQQRGHDGKLNGPEPTGERDRKQRQDGMLGRAGATRERIAVDRLAVLSATTPSTTATTSSATTRPSTRIVCPRSDPPRTSHAAEMMARAPMSSIASQPTTAPLWPGLSARSRTVSAARVGTANPIGAA
jgi:hypothetical protein